MDSTLTNKMAWDQMVEEGNESTIPVSADEIREARQGNWRVTLAGEKAVPQSWFPDLVGASVLCLASGGGQQAPILAAAGARVTVLDNSPRQLEQDRLVAERDGLDLTTLEGDMCDLSAFPDGTFDLVFNPCSSHYVANILAVWQEAFRVLGPQGTLLTGFFKPVCFIFDQQLDRRGILELKHRLPYSDQATMSPQQLKTLQETRWPFEFSHTLDDLIGGQIEAGFVITGFYEDSWPPVSTLEQYLPTMLVVRAVKPGPAPG